MKYLSIDIETTGVEFENDQILSIGIIVEDTTKKLPFNEIPKLHLAIVRDRIEGNLFALNMNRDLLQNINAWNSANDLGKEELEEKTGMIFVKENEVVQRIFEFLFKNDSLHENLYNPAIGHMIHVRDNDVVPLIGLRTPVSNLTVAGKNISIFDKPFLEKLPRWNDVFKINRRTIDPTILFTNWNEDKELPNLTVCKERAGTGDIVTHDAIDDAWDIIQLLRTQY